MAPSAFLGRGRTGVVELLVHDLNRSYKTGAPPERHYESPMRITRPLLVTAFLGCAALGASCAKNPVTGNTDITTVSKKGEVEQGRKAHEQVIRFYGIYEDQGLQDYVTQIGTKLAQASERPELEWHFTVVDADDINAFALPGGYIYITRGIMAYLNSEAELAAVLGHEIGHVTARHSDNQISKQKLAQLGLVLGSIFFTEARPF